MDKNINPVISVIMPVYNAEKYVKSAIESILSQSFQDFELLIFNDCATDNSLTIIQSFSDPRIKLFSSLKNLGYLIHLNKGIDLAQGKYIARMDADDISMPQRFEKQVAFMDAHKDYGLVGTWAQILDSEQHVKPCVEDMAIRLQLLKMNQFFHSSVLIRKSILTNNHLYYNKEFYTAEDYELWVRISSFCKIGNLNEFLVKYRIHDEQISSIYNKNQIEKSNHIKVFQIENHLGIKLSHVESDCYLQILNFKPSSESDLLNEIKLINRLKAKCVEKSKSKNFYYYLSRQLKKDLNKNIHHYLFNKFVLQPNRYNWKLLYSFTFYKIPPLCYFKINEAMRFIFKCLIFYKKVQSI